MKGKLYAPAYYKRFACIAEKCRHSCCVDWEIDVDGETVEKYASSSHPYAKTVLQSIIREETPHFCLREGGRCPHLDEHGLCNIITHMGEEYLCDICRQHPRFYHDTPQGKEVGLGMCCEEACRLILTSDDFDSLLVVGQAEGEGQTGFDSLPMREELYRILARRDLSYEKKREEIYEAFGVSPRLLTDEAWRKTLDELEYLNESHRALLAQYAFYAVTEAEWEPVLTRALAYYIFRHVAEAQSEEEAKVSLALSLFLERLLASVVAAERPASLDGVAELARLLSEELEYSEDNLAALRFEIFSVL